MKGIPTDLYTDIHQHMPIICVDIVIYYNESILLIKRSVEPAKDEWWFPGGRLLKLERLRNAPERIVKKETNLEITQLSYIGFDETVFDTDPFGHGEKTHTINHVYSARIREKGMLKLALDQDHSACRWMPLKHIYTGNYHDYIKKFVGISERDIKS